MRKVQFGSGPNRLKGWENYDRDVRLDQPLIAFHDDSVDRILCCHVIEHLTPRPALRCLEEFYRILRPSGVLRLMVPGIERIYHLASPEHLEFMRAKGWIREARREHATLAAVRTHGHMSWWTEEVLTTLLLSIGFSVEFTKQNESRHPELRGIDTRLRNVTPSLDLMETIRVEAIKP
jgi:predicted SAM-dependent methyltransferase